MLSYRYIILEKVGSSMNRGLIAVFLALCLLLSLAACEKKEVIETIPATIHTEAATEAAQAETEPEAPALLKQPEDGKICVGFVPTEAGTWRYAVIEDQEAAAAAFEKAVNAKYSDEWWIKGDKTLGLMVAYKGEFWDFVDSGELVNALGRVKAEDAASLYAFCAGTAWEAGWKDAVTPEQITGVVSATLRLSGKEILLTDTAALEQLEGMLSLGKFTLGGTGCPFTALLDLELETGEILTIALATDSCGAWMSEGNYYDYGSDSQSLYDLFGVTLKFGEIEE